MIRAVAIIVPVHDEELLLGECLSAIARARARLPAAVTCVVVVVLDSCTDGSAAIVAEAFATDDIEAVAVDYRNVGGARACGVERALQRLDGAPLRDVWIATTDADSRVPETWLIDQIGLADAGVDALAGVVTVLDWGEYPRDRACAYEDFYASAHALDDDAHDHVHGANLGVRATTYLAAGGFAPLVTGEDHALWKAVRLVGHRSVSTRRITVTTSSRLVARAPRGFAAFLASFRV